MIGYPWGNHGARIVLVRGIQDRGDARIGIGLEPKAAEPRDLRSAGWVLASELDELRARIAWLEEEAKRLSRERANWEANAEAWKNTYHMAAKNLEDATKDRQAALSNVKESTVE
jgi:uncharacterized small protein (DUF1192 family)